MLHFICICTAATLLAGCASPTAHVYPINEVRLVAHFPNLPADARQVTERLVSCRYWAGEITTTDAQRDAEIYAALRDFQCATIRQDEAAIRAKYVGNPAVEKAFDTAAHWFAG